jgi:hypothetical protein
MLSVADQHLASLNPKARLVMFGQELNAIKDHWEYVDAFAAPSGKAAPLK